MPVRVHSVALAGALALVTACAMNAPRVPLRTAPFDPAEYAPYGRLGAGEIAGQVYRRTRAGEVRYGAGSEVYLEPVTSYSTEWWNRAIVSGSRLQPGDPRARAYGKTVKADAQGRFVFTGLPPGEYYVASSVFWEYYDGQLVADMSPESAVGQRVRLGDRGRAELVLDGLHATVAEGGGTAPIAVADIAFPAERGEVEVSASLRLARHTGFRQAIGDAMRLGIVADYAEDRPGRLILILGPGYSTASTVEYHFKRVYSAYGDYLNHNIAPVLELRLRGEVIGDYSWEGLSIDPKLGQAP